MVDLDANQRLKLLRQKLYASVGYKEHVTLSVATKDRYTVVSLPDGEVQTPSPLRWKLYKRGWRQRLRHIAREFGIGTEYTLAPGDLVIDIGANIGEFSIAAASFGAEVRAFEPDPDAAACFEANTQSHAHIELHQEVLWKEIAEIDFYLAAERADSSTFEPEIYSSTVRRRTQTLDAFAAAEGLSAIKLIKCDAEGAEPEVLLGAEKTLAITENIAIDTGAERNGARTNEECAALLTAAGFEVKDRKIGTRWITFGAKPTGRA